MIFLLFQYVVCSVLSFISFRVLARGPLSQISLEILDCSSSLARPPFPSFGWALGALRVGAPRRAGHLAGEPLRVHAKSRYAYLTYAANLPAKSVPAESCRLRLSSLRAEHLQTNSPVPTGTRPAGRRGRRSARKMLCGFASQC